MRTILHFAVQMEDEEMAGVVRTVVTLMQVHLFISRLQNPRMAKGRMDSVHSAQCWLFMLPLISVFCDDTWKMTAEPQSGGGIWGQDFSDQSLSKVR